MMGNYRLTPEADNDLVIIWLYTFENWGIDQANSYLEKLENQFLALSQQPNIGRPVDQIRQGYRCFHYNRHLIFYRSQMKNQIEIVRILHDRMAVDQHFD